MIIMTQGVEGLFLFILIFSYVGWLSERFR